MCLDTIYPIKKRDKWLASQPDVILAYKVVQVTSFFPGDPVKLHPPMFHTGDNYYKRKNLLPLNSAGKESKSIRERFWKKIIWDKYISYFYLFQSIIDAEDFRNWGLRTCGHSCTKVIKCTIDKSLITSIGKQSCNDKGLTIITRGFDIIGEDEYLEEGVAECV